MNTDIRLSTTCFAHAKIVKLERRLGSDGVLSLLKLWIYTAQHREKGVLYGMTEEDIAIAAGWNGDEKRFVSELLNLRLIDLVESNYEIHNWRKHNPYAAFSEVRSEAGRKGAVARWNRDKNVDRIANDGNRIANDGNRIADRMIFDAPAPAPAPEKGENNLTDAAQAPVAHANPPLDLSAGFPPEFIAVWEAYPKRNGDNRKVAAYRAWHARIDEGHSAAEILAGTQRYAVWCVATGKTNTEYVKQAVTFFGREKCFLEAWDLPATPPRASPQSKAEQLHNHNQRAVAEWLAKSSALDRPVIDGEVSHVTH